jgi:hypothetical protein
MDCTTIYIGSTLQIAEHLMRFSPGLDDKNCWYAIYPEVVDHPNFGDVPYPPEVMEENGRMVLNFYDEHYNQIENQPEDPYPYVDDTTSNNEGAVPGAAGGEGSPESIRRAGRHVQETVAAGVDTNHQGGNETNPPADQVSPLMQWFKPIWRDFCGQS